MLNKLRKSVADFLKSVPSRLYGSRIDLQAEGATYLHSSAKVVPMAYLEILDKKLAAAHEKLGEVQPKGRGT